MKRMAILLVLSLFFTLRTSAQFSEELYSQIDQCVKEYYKDKKFNGSVLVAKKGEILITKGWGSDLNLTGLHRRPNPVESIQPLKVHISSACRPKAVLAPAGVQLPDPA